MGFQVGQVCYPDSQSALDGWMAQYPTVPDVNGNVWYVGNAVISSGGVITGNFKQSITGNSTAISGITLSACSAQSASFVFDKYPIQDIGFAVALVVVFLFGFLSGRVR